MRILYLANNRAGYLVARWLREQGLEVVGAVLHPTEKAKYREEIQHCLPPNTPIFDASRLREPETLRAISALQPEMGLSIYFGYILKPDLLERFPRGVVNLHPSYLPYNRGAHPNVWSLVEGTPAGVTLHYVDAGIDTGDMIAQERVATYPWDTGKTLYDRLEESGVALVQRSWPLLELERPPRTPQNPISGTTHRIADLARLDEIDPDGRYTGQELIDLLRARTFPPYPGVCMRVDGKRITLRVELTCEEEDRL